MRHHILPFSEEYEAWARNIPHVSMWFHSCLQQSWNRNERRWDWTPSHWFRGRHIGEIETAMMCTICTQETNYASSVLRNELSRYFSSDELLARKQTVKNHRSFDSDRPQRAKRAYGANHTQSRAIFRFPSWLRFKSVGMMLAYEKSYWFIPHYFLRVFIPKSVEFGWNSVSAYY